MSGLKTPRRETDLRTSRTIKRPLDNETPVEERNNSDEEEEEETGRKSNVME